MAMGWDDGMGYCQSSQKWDVSQGRKELDNSHVEILDFLFE